jgi:hypothetical protein
VAVSTNVASARVAWYSLIDSCCVRSATGTDSVLKHAAVSAAALLTHGKRAELMVEAPGNWRKKKEKKHHFLIFISPYKFFFYKFAAFLQHGGCLLLIWRLEYPLKKINNDLCVFFYTKMEPAGLLSPLRPRHNDMH